MYLHKSFQLLRMSPLIGALLLFQFIISTSPANAGWQQVESPTSNRLFSVHFISENDGWAVGEQGTIIHYDGSNWQLVESPTSVRLSEVHFNSATDGWAVGRWGTILHYDGSCWQVVCSDSSLGSLTSVYFTSVNSGWVCGNKCVSYSYDGFIMHYDGEDWTVVYYESEAGWRSLYFISEDEGWVVGLGKYVGGVGCLSAAHYTNGEWHPIFLPYEAEWFVDVYFISPGNGWATAAPGCSGPEAALTWHYNGTDWNPVENPAPDDSYGIGGIYFVDENDGWTVGTRSTSDGFIMHFDGTSWSLAESKIGGCLYDVYFINSDNGWAVGSLGTILKYQDGTGVKNGKKRSSNSPENYTLSQNYPNPFNSTTTISYSIAKPAETKLEIFDLQGQQIRVLLNGMKPAGFYSLTWDGSDNEGKPVSSGVYLYQLRAGNLTRTNKCILIN